jgi:hypothetical protein
MIPRPKDSKGYTLAEAEQICGRAVTVYDVIEAGIEIPHVDLTSFTKYWMDTFKGNLIMDPLFTKKHMSQLITYYAERALLSIK